MDNNKRAPGYVGYGVLILAAYFIQFAPFMVKIYGAYPMPLLMVTVIIAMFESDLTAGIIGLICGLRFVHNSRLSAFCACFRAQAAL